MVVVLSRCTSSLIRKYWVIDFNDIGVPDLAMKINFPLPEPSDSVWLVPGTVDFTLD